MNKLTSTFLGDAEQEPGERGHGKRATFSDGAQQTNQSYVPFLSANHILSQYSTVLNG
jgi:hypothetical protein